MKQFKFETMLQRTGGWYIIFSIAIGQIVGLIGAVPGLLSIKMNVELSEELGRQLSSAVPILFIISQIILIGICWQITSNARNRLSSMWGFGNSRPDTPKDIIAWKEITNLTTSYGVYGFLTNIFFNALIPAGIALAHRDTISSIFQPTSINAPTPFYILIGGTAAILGAIVLTLLIIERLTMPARIALLPRDFESQFTGRTGVLIGLKFQILTSALIFIAIAVIAPIGYQQTIRILYAEVSSFDVFANLQTQSLVFSGMALILGIGFSYFATRSISDPVNKLIGTLQKIEDGDLSQRVPVIATDELATVAIQFNRMVSRLEILQTTLENQVAERTKQLTATNEVGRVASSILDPDELLVKIANLITEQFNYYYVAVYLIDSSQKWAELKEATGQAGNVLKQNRHRTELSGRSIVANCIREKMPRMIQNTAEEKQRFDNPLLPYTKSEIALPLVIGDRVLGALDVQSTKPSDFGADVIETMQNMAGQVAIALENARLFQEAQQSISELRAIQKQYLFEGWSSIKSYNENLEYGVGENSDTAGHTLESSINLRDQIFGQITIDGSEEWTPEQRLLVDAVATQAAIALENARLVSESRQIAMRERTLTEINSKIWSSPTIDNVLQTAIKELGKRLDAANATIELKLDDES